MKTRRQIVAVILIVGAFIAGYLVKEAYAHRWEKNQKMIQSYLNNKGAHFKVINRVGESEFDILCRQINIEKTNYAFVLKSDLERGLRDDPWIGLVLFVNGQKPTKYLFLSTVWNEPNQLFTDSAVKNPEYGINLNQHIMKLFVEKYGFEQMIRFL